MTALRRCGAAHTETARPCDGPQVVRLVDTSGREVTACTLHGAALYADSPMWWVHAIPGYATAAREICQRAQRLARAYPWIAAAADEAAEGVPA